MTRGGPSHGFLHYRLTPGVPVRLGPARRRRRPGSSPGETDLGPHLERNWAPARGTRPSEHRLLCRVTQKGAPTSPLPTDKLNGKTTGQSVSNSSLSVLGFHFFSARAPFPQYPARSGFRRKASSPSSAQNRGGGPAPGGPTPAVALFPIKMLAVRGSLAHCIACGFPLDRNANRLPDF